MADFNLEDFVNILNNKEVFQYLVDKKVIKEKKFLETYEYEKELHELQIQLTAVQNTVIAENKRVLIIFEGRDAAGKGGAIERLVEYLNPKKLRVVSLPKPTEEESNQWYFQRYFKQLPNAGELVFFDRSWYNRAVVEPVFGFCTEEQYKLFLKQVKEVEELLIQDGVILIKLFLTISKEEQAKRLEERKTDVLKQWKIGPLDKQAQEKWDTYSIYIKELFKNTSTKKTPWVEIETDNKKKARLEVFKIIINQISNQKIGKIEDIVKIYN
ncbi:polyphosphate kinase [Sphingobacterium sp. ML3W]|uniref:polyphosphate kinase 2 n=1 Tax=Sphingobacterium TaxID=28453 RepID=UPI0004F58EDE|nr:MULTISPECIES: polyphosphate kinase 2 [Sphingobacterium]AIM36509.1 polyphosphate kinase [Sphingobacterium sp. ML3W]MDH5827348.1 polyphosphate kinase 2 [Sphingobacterium faecium]